MQTVGCLRSCSRSGRWLRSPASSPVGSNGLRQATAWRDGWQTVAGLTSTHFPGLRCGGISTESTTDTGPDFKTRPALKLPLHRPLVWPAGSLLSSQGGGKQGSGVSSQLVQSRPATGIGHGLQNGCCASTAWQLGPRQRAGIWRQQEIPSEGVGTR